MILRFDIPQNAFLSDTLMLLAYSARYWDGLCLFARLRHSCDFECRRQLLPVTSPSPALSTRRGRECEILEIPRLRNFRSGSFPFTDQYTIGLLRSNASRQLFSSLDSIIHIHRAHQMIPPHFPPIVLICYYAQCKICMTCRMRHCLFLVSCCHRRFLSLTHSGFERCA